MSNFIEIGAVFKHERVTERQSYFRIDDIIDMEVWIHIQILL